jgi:hypothetical protein
MPTGRPARSGGARGDTTKRRAALSVPAYRLRRPAWPRPDRCDVGRATRHCGPRRAGTRCGPGARTTRLCRALRVCRDGSVCPVCLVSPVWPACRVVPMARRRSEPASGPRRDDPTNRRWGGRGGRGGRRPGSTRYGNFRPNRCGIHRRLTSGRCGPRPGGASRASPAVGPDRAVRHGWDLFRRWTGQMRGRGPGWGDASGVCRSPR